MMRPRATGVFQTDSLPRGEGCRFISSLEPSSAINVDLEKDCLLQTDSTEAKTNNNELTIITNFSSTDQPRNQGIP
jgi:hypothetical protein